MGESREEREEREKEEKAEETRMKGARREGRQAERECEQVQTGGLHHDRCCLTC